MKVTHPSSRFRRFLIATLPRWLWRGSNEEWENYGKLDPYFGVISHERFHSSELSRTTLDDFFDSGAKHVEEVIGVIRNHIRADFRPARALDFGCGVGRVTIPLAGICARVVGVDVSESMLKEARTNCDARHVVNVDLLGSDDTLSAVPGSFDFIHSYIVLQHIPPKRGERLIRTLIERLSDNGIGVLQFTYHRRASTGRRALHWMRRTVPLVNSVANAAQGRALLYPLMDMHNYDLNRIFIILQELDCHQSHIRFTDHGGHLGVALFLVKRALPSL